MRSDYSVLLVVLVLGSCSQSGSASPCPARGTVNVLFVSASSSGGQLLLQDLDDQRVLQLERAVQLAEEEINNDKQHLSPQWQSTQCGYSELKGT